MNARLVHNSATPAETAEDLDKWFREGYAALYVENAWERGDEFAQYIADVITYRSDNGVAASDVNGFVVDSLEGWRSEGWLGTDVEELDTKLLNATTAVFDIKWLDRNADGSTENNLAETAFISASRSQKHSVKHWAKGDTVDFVSRFFVPKGGIDEDPVTGSAHCTLVPFWAERLGRSELVAHQVSSRGGELHCELRGDRVIMSGHCVHFLTGSIHL